MNDTLPILNTELLTQVIKWAEESEKAPDTEPMPGWGVWGQTMWFRRSSRLQEVTCGTAYCIAGQVAHQAGYEPVWDDASVAHYCRLPGGFPVSASEVAQETLGLTADEATAMFNANNTIADVQAVANHAYTQRGLGTPYPDTHVPTKADISRWSGSLS